MVSPEAIARQPNVLSAAAEQRVSSDGHRESSHDGSFGVLGLESQRPDPTRRIPWMRKWGIVAIMMAVSFLAIILVALAVSRDADVRALADITPVHRVAFSSCTQRHVGENPIWTQVRISFPVAGRNLSLEYSCTPIWSMQALF